MSNCPCKKSCPDIASPALEIVKEAEPVLFHLVEIQADEGDHVTLPADTLNYKNVLLHYLADGYVYLYSSDGIPVILAEGNVGDFDNLIHRPKYNGEIMTHETEIPKVPESLSELSDGERVTFTEQEIEQLKEALANEATAREEAVSALQSNIDTNTNAIASANEEISDVKLAVQDLEDSTVQLDTSIAGDSSTVTVTKKQGKLNGDTPVDTEIPLPVASAESAGVMNPATFQAVQNNAEDIDAILNGAVALEDLPATPTQAELTDAWKTATNKTELVNRASIFDVTNQKLWYYYSNVSSWFSIENVPSSVTVSQATNTTLGIVKGDAETPGKIFIEPDGSQSVNNWDGITHDLENLTELVHSQTIPKLYTSYSTATDGANTAAFINSKLNSKNIVLGQQSSIKQTELGNVVIGYKNSQIYPNTHSAAIIIGHNNNDSSYDAGTTSPNILIGYNITASSTGNLGIGYSVGLGKSSLAIGNSSRAGDYAIALGRGAAATFNHSMALGMESHTSREAEVSFGWPNNTVGAPTARYLANVKTGELDTDAVNVKQMKDYVSSNPSPVFFATPTLNEESGALVVTPPSGATTPTAGDSVFLKFDSTVGTSTLPYAMTSGLMLEYAGGTAFPIKAPNVTSPLISDYTNLTVIKANTRYFLIFDGEQWIIIMPQAINSAITVDEFNAEWEAA